MVEQLTDIQRQIVEAPPQGEIVVGGVAGSGKTLAAVHRAAHLAEHAPGRTTEPAVLFLCYNRALAKALRAHLSAFPARIASRIRVRTVHSYCAGYVSRLAPDCAVIEGDGERLALVRAAVKEAQYGLGPLDIFEHDAAMFLDEIRLIKGCDLRELDDYLDRRVARTGALAADDYAAIFQVAQHYERLLRAQRRLDYDDFALIALSALERSRSAAVCDHVIIDETQDLSDRQVALGRRLARRSLLLIADQDQAIYRVTQLADTLPERYDLVLPDSLRTTAEIFDHARRLLPGPGAAPLPERHGPPPRYLPFRWSDEEAGQICRLVSDALAAGVAPDEIAVLARTRELLTPVREALRDAGIEATVEVSHAEAGGVRLSTIHGAKGREFHTVILVGMVEGVLPALRPEMDRAAVAQELALARRQLYVAMTRARAQLWLTSSEGQPSRLLYEVGLLTRPEEAQP